MQKPGGVLGTAPAGNARGQRGDGGGQALLAGAHVLACRTLQQWPLEPVPQGEVDEGAGCVQARLKAPVVRGRVSQAKIPSVTFHMVTLFKL